MEGVFMDAWEHTAYLAKETFDVVVHGAAQETTFQSKGFSTPTEVAVLGIICLFNIIVCKIAEVSQVPSILIFVPQLPHPPTPFRSGWVI